MNRFIASAILSASVLTGVACQPTEPPPVVSIPTETLVVGDSITWQVVMSGQFPADMVSHTYMGWQAKDVQAKITEMTNNGTLGHLVIALGTNDANPTWNGGWTQADVDRWNTMLNTPADGVPISIVLPWLSPNASPVHQAEVNEARAWMQTIPNVTIVDWQDYATGPGVIQADGIHLEGAITGESLPAAQVAIDARLAAIREAT